MEDVLLWSLPKPLLVARNQEKLDEVANEIYKEYNIAAQTFSVDLSDVTSTQKFIDEISSLDIGLLIHSAGIENNGSFTKISTEKELQLINLNVTSTYLMAHHFAKKMTAKGNGGILLVSSLVGLMPSPYFSNYSASKSFVHNLGISLYGELKSKGVDVSVLYPGLTDTPMAGDAGVDWSQLPMASMSPEKVAQISLSKIGKKATIIPGFGNKMMATMAKYMLPAQRFSRLNGYLTLKGISEANL